MVQYNWSKYNTVTTQVTTYGNERMTASGTGSGTFQIRSSYGMSSSTGYYDSGSLFTPTTGSTGYFVQSSTVLIAYTCTSKVGSTWYYNYWRYELTATLTPSYSQGSFISSFVAEEYAYTDNARNSDGYWYVRGSVYTPPTETPLSAPSNARVQSKTESAVTFAWDAVSGASKYAVELYYIDGSGGETFVEGFYNVTTLTKFFSGLFSDSTYKGKVYAISASGMNGYASYTPNFTTYSYPSPVTNLVASPTSNSVSLSWSSATGATTYSAEIYIQGTSTNPVKFEYGFTGTSKTFTGLNPNTSYTAKVYGSNASGNGDADYENFTTTSSSRPTNFSWTTSKSTGGEFNLTALEWNDLCAKVNQFRVYKSLSVYTFTSASTGGTFYYYMFNEVRTAISAMNPPTALPSSATSGGDIHASMLNGLVGSLNSIT